MKFSAALLPLLLGIGASAKRLRNNADNEADGRELWGNSNHHSKPSCVWSHADTCPHGGKGYCDSDKWACESWGCKGKWYQDGCNQKPSHHQPQHEPQNNPYYPAPEPWYPDVPADPWQPEPWHPEPTEPTKPKGKAKEAFVNNKTFETGEEKAILEVGPFTINGLCDDGRFELRVTATAMDEDIFVFGRGERNNDRASTVINAGDNEMYDLLRVTDVNNERSAGAFSSSNGYYVAIDGESCIAIQRDDPDVLGLFGENVNCVLSCQFSYDEPEKEEYHHPW